MNKVRCDECNREMTPFENGNGATTGKKCMHKQNSILDLINVDPIIKKEAKCIPTFKESIEELKDSEDHYTALEVEADFFLFMNDIIPFYLQKFKNKAFKVMGSQDVEDFFTVLMPEYKVSVKRGGSKKGNLTLILTKP